MHTADIYQPVGEWGDGKVQNLDFIVTEDCNLRCKYCYVCHKTSEHIMDFDTAKIFIDYVLDDKFIKEPAVILSFIGGEPLLEVELIDRIVDYFKTKTYEMNHEWSWNYRLSITTNGVNYNTPAVQKFIKKNKNKMSLTITIDGTKQKHDLQRVFPDGSGSYDIVQKNIPLYLKQFYGTTKVTFAHADLPLLKESIIHLFKMGIREVSANVVFENVWKEQDDVIFEKQLKSLADEMIDSELYRTCYVSFFNDLIGRPIEKDELQMAPCGTGRMLSLGPNGKIYPCMRYKDYSLESGKEEITIGDVVNGIDFDKVMRFRLASYQLQLDDECIHCEIASGCQYCQGQNYDAASSNTNFERSKYICKMYKARVRANNYYYNRLYNEKKIKRSDYRNEYKKMYFVLMDNVVSMCGNIVEHGSLQTLSRDLIIKGLQYCEQNFFSPVFLHSVTYPLFELLDDFPQYRIKHIISAKYALRLSGYSNYILVFTKDTILQDVPFQDHIIFNIDSYDICNLKTYVEYLFRKTIRINLNIIGELTYEEILVYRDQLKEIAELLAELWCTEQRPLKELNRITDVFFEENSSSCRAGDKDFTIAPDGRFYVCPMEINDSKNAIGSLEEGTIHLCNQRLYTLDYSVLCKKCMATHCMRCQYRNKRYTGEVNIPARSKCQISFLEYEVSRYFRDLCKEGGCIIKLKDIKPLQYNNPFDEYESNQNYHMGFQIQEVSKS